jgi:hypothetical protein
MLLSLVVFTLTITLEKQLKEKRLLWLTFTGFQLWLAASIASGPVEKQNIVAKEY